MTVDKSDFLTGHQSLDGETHRGRVPEASRRTNMETVVPDLLAVHSLVPRRHFRRGVHCDPGGMPAFPKVLASIPRSRGEMPSRLCSAHHHGDERYNHGHYTRCLPHPHHHQVYFTRQEVAPLLHLEQPELIGCRKISLILSFALSLILVAITLYRVVGVIDRHANQQFRSLVASLEILAAAGVSNAIVLGSFIRDRGVKKQRFRFGSIAGSSSMTSGPQTRTRTLATRNWGSDEDLVRELGIGGPASDLVAHKEIPRPAPVALPLAQDAEHVTPQVHSGWTFPTRPRESASTDETDLKAKTVIDEDAIEPVPPGLSSPPDAPPITPRRMSFFDVGGLLGDDVAARHYPPPLPPTSTVSPLPTPPLPTPASGTSNFHRRSSSAFLQDIGGLLSPSELEGGKEGTDRPRSGNVKNFSRPQSTPQQQLQPPPQEAMAELAQEISDSRRPSPMSLMRLQEEGRDRSRPRAPEETQLSDVGGLLH